MKKTVFEVRRRAICMLKKIYRFAQVYTTKQDTRGAESVSVACDAPYAPQKTIITGSSSHKIQKKKQRTPPCLARSTTQTQPAPQVPQELRQELHPLQVPLIERDQPPVESDVEHEHAGQGRGYVRPDDDYRHNGRRKVTPLPPSDQSKGAGGHQAEHEPRTRRFGADAVHASPFRKNYGRNG